MSEGEEGLVGEFLDDRAKYTLGQLCELCGVGDEVVIELVEHGVLRPEGQAPAQWRFSSRMLVRSRKAHRLRRDLDLNVPGVALCLELLDEIETLRLEVRRLKGRR